MRKFIGVRSWPGAIASQSLKRDALIFNQIAIPDISVFIEDALLKSNRGTRFVIKDANGKPVDVQRLLTKSGFLRLPTKEARYLAAEFQWLLDRGIIFEPEIGFQNTTLRKNSKGIIARAMGEVSTTLGQEGLQELDDFARGPIYSRAVNQIAFSEYNLREASLILRRMNQLDAYPVFSFKPRIWQERRLNKQDVVQIVLKALPMPDDLTSGELIMDYRSDANSQGRFLGLRHWMGEVARAELTPIEVEEKLEYLMYQYDQHMKLHKLKTNPYTLETAVVAVPEFLENLVNFRWGKIAKGLFAFKHRRIALMEAELTAPGSEIAYIMKARQRFS
ncbi:MAG: hypothetical protein ACREBG_01030 [Pyrinomonadaceae bacterium]